MIEKVDTKIKIINGDILEQRTEAIVNPCKTTILEGGAIDRELRRIGGELLKEECKKLNGCPIGEAKITKAFNLKTDYIIHTATVIWRGGMFEEEKLLESSYKNCLEKALENNISEISFPSLSTGTHMFPKKKAVEIAIKTIEMFLEENKELKKVYIVCKDKETYNAYISYSNLL